MAAHKPPSHTLPPSTSASCDGIEYVPDPELAETFAAAIKRHKARCNARDLAVSEARARREMHELGVVWEGE